MKKRLKGLLIALFLCGTILPNGNVKAEELEDVEKIEVIMDDEDLTGETSVVGSNLVSEDYTYTVLKDGTVQIVKYTGSATTLDIPSVLGGREVTSIGEEAFKDNSSLVIVTIQNGIESIGKYAFGNCGSLTTITIPSSITSMESEAFYECSNLTTVTIQSRITRIESRLFEKCSSLKKIIIPNTVTVIAAQAFKDCSSLEEIIIPESVTVIGTSAFEGCSSLSKIKLPKGLTYIGNSVLYDCSNLTSITIPNGVTRIGPSAFRGCSGLTNVTIPNTVKRIESNAFYECSNLVGITIPNSVTYIDVWVFDKCASGFTIYCNAGSDAYRYATENKHSYEFSMYLCEVTLSTTTYTYDGKEKKPIITVMDGSKTLKEGREYTVKYPDNKAIGKTTITITGIGYYGGVVTKTITINKADYYNANTHGGKWQNGAYYLGGVKMTDIFFSEGEYTYYLQADGTPMKNRLTYHPDGIHLIYLDDKGHELFDQFQYCADVGYTCYFDTYGYLYKDVITFSNDKAYYLDGTGKMKQNEWFKFDNGVDIGYAQADGSLINTGFGYDPFGNTVFYHWNGMVARGLITDGTWYYDMNVTDGHLIGQFAAN